MRQIIIWAHERSDIVLSDIEVLRLREERLVQEVGNQSKPSQNSILSLKMCH